MIALSVVGACAPQSRPEQLGPALDGGATDGDGSGLPAATAAGTSATGEAEGGDPSIDDDDDGDDALFDVAGNGGGLEAGDPSAGCEKVDFLFVIDSSGSMADEQNNLATSFPGFLSGIQSTVSADDYHIMVVDTGPTAGMMTSSCSPAPSCCDIQCATNPGTICNGEPCGGLEACPATLGAGRTGPLNGAPCNLPADRPYLVEGDPDLAGTFACLAKVGTDGSGDERPIQSLLDGMTPGTTASTCNEGFLRPDAVLVVTIITDEEDDHVSPTGTPDPSAGSPGEPPGWYDDLLAVKMGNETALVVLGLIGDTGQPVAICTPLATDGVIGAEASPRLRGLTEMFGERGFTGSVCAPDYAPFFAEAVSVIASACEGFDPEG